MVCTLSQGQPCGDRSVAIISTSLMNSRDAWEDADIGEWENGEMGKWGNIHYHISPLAHYQILMADESQSPQLPFTAFVVSLASTAAIHFGDLEDPGSGQRVEPNLEGAAQMIDILEMLEVKTRGNLTAEERQILEQVLYELRLRYVEAKSGGKRIIEP